MARWMLDESNRPLFVLHLDDPSGKAGPPDFESLIQMLDRLKSLSAASRCRVVFDLTGATPDAQRRKRFVAWLREEGMAMSDRVDALAVVAPSTFLRGTLTAVRWFFPEDGVKNEVFETRAAALTWARAQAR